MGTTEFLGLLEIRRFALGARGLREIAGVTRGQDALAPLFVKVNAWCLRPNRRPVSQRPYDGKSGFNTDPDWPLVNCYLIVGDGVGETGLCARACSNNTVSDDAEGILRTPSETEKLPRSR